jgi:hypothetical protein
MAKLDFFGAFLLGLMKLEMQQTDNFVSQGITIVI